MFAPIVFFDGDSVMEDCSDAHPMQVENGYNNSTSLAL